MRPAKTCYSSPFFTIPELSKLGAESFLANPPPEHFTNQAQFISTLPPLRKGGPVDLDSILGDPSSTSDLPRTGLELLKEFGDKLLWTALIRRLALGIRFPTPSQIGRGYALPFRKGGIYHFTDLESDEVYTTLIALSPDRIWVFVDSKHSWPKSFRSHPLLPKRFSRAWPPAPPTSEVGTAVRERSNAINISRACNNQIRKLSWDTS